MKSSHFAHFGLVIPVDFSMHCTEQRANFFVDKQQKIPFLWLIDFFSKS
jgi:hypothetical protein